MLRGVRWEEYEALLQTFVEAKGLRLSYDEGRLEIMVLSAEHESYAELIKQLVGTLSLRLRIKVLHFGSATMRKKGQSKGAEADACFYVQSADSIGNRKQIDFSSDPPPDIVAEVDLHHESIAKSRFMQPSVFRKFGATTGRRSASITSRRPNMLKVTRALRSPC